MSQELFFSAFMEDCGPKGVSSFIVVFQMYNFTVVQGTVVILECVSPSLYRLVSVPADYSVPTEQIEPLRRLDPNSVMNIKLIYNSQNIV